MISNKLEMNLESSTNFFKHVGQIIRSGTVNVGRHNYALGLAQGVKQAIHCGYNKIAVFELGVAHGNGLLDLCQAAHVFRELLHIDIRVYGLDNAVGLPPFLDHRDHPEIWGVGDYKMEDPEVLRKKLPPFAELIIGDVGETVAEMQHKIGDAKIAYVAIDLDYYSSTVKAMKLFTFEAEQYIPAVPVYFDDVDQHLTYNDWCGEAAAITEFNQEHALRKIDRKPLFSIPRFFVCHVLDHPIRKGIVKPRIPLSLLDF